MSNQYTHKYSEKDYISKCQELGLIYQGNHKQKHKGTMIDFICPIHKDKGVQSKDWSHFKTYSKGCSYCTGRHKTTEEIIPLIKNKDVQVISEYYGNEKPIKCQCKKCGNIWETLPKVLITNGSGCPKCGREKIIASRKKSLTALINELEKVNPNIEIIGQYKGVHKKIKCRCKIDNYEFTAYPANLLNLSSGCPMCSMSLGEQKLLQILTELQIPFISQYQFEDCKYIRPLKFDAYDNVHNIAFEYNGEQHYRIVDFTNHNYQQAKETFDLTQARDKTKYQYCKDNNIPIIIIPYWERNNMKEFIVQQLKELKINVFNN